MKILITGHEGFIGTGLWSLLRKEHELVGLDKKSGHDINTVDLPEVDLVIHLAGIGGVRESIDNPGKYWHNNVTATKRLLQHYGDKRVLVASSSSQYEPHKNPYAASKHVMEFIEHPQVVWMRFHTVYNEQARTGMFFDKLFQGTLEYVTEHERDFIHRNDLVQAIRLLIHSSYTGPIDIGTGVTTRISDIVPTLPVKKGHEGERERTCADTTLLKQATGFEATIQVKDFLEEHNEKIRNYYT